MNHNLHQSNKEKQTPPYCLRPGQVEGHFGIKANTIYHWISIGQLIRGKHYLKKGPAVLIIREEFIKFLQKEDGTNVN